MFPDLPPDWSYPDTVPGWLTEAEGRALAGLALLSSPAPVLEVGSYHGRSTICLAQVASLVVSVDHHTGDPGSGHRPFPGSLPHLQANLARYNLTDRALLLVASFADAAPRLLESGQRFGLIFLDASHDEDSTFHDVSWGLRLLLPDGILALHDWGYSTVRDGTARALAQHGKPGIAPAGMIDSLFWTALPTTPPI